MHFDLLGVFIAGLLTFFSPCILPLVPLYLSMLTQASIDELRRGRSSARLLLATGAFSLGLAVVFVGLGLAATAVGHALVAHRLLLLQLGGLLVFLFGLKLVGVIQVPWLDGEARPWLRRVGNGGGLLGSFLLGAAFGLGWTPCVGPVLGSVLTYAVSTAAPPATGAAYLALYAAGLTLPLFAVAAATPVALAWVDRAKRHLRKFEVASGMLLALVGLLLMTDTLDRLMPAWGEQAPTPTLAAEEGQRNVASAAKEAAPSLVCDAATGCPIDEGAAGPMMVEFVSRSCPVCARMAPIVAAVERDCASHGVRVTRVDVGVPGILEEARRRGIRGVPTFLFLDREGQEVARLVGEQSLDRLKQSLDVMAGGRCSGFRPFS